MPCTSEYQEHVHSIAGVLLVRRVCVLKGADAGDLLQHTVAGFHQEAVINSVHSALAFWFLCSDRHPLQLHCVSMTSCTQVGERCAIMLCSHACAWEVEREKGYRFVISMWVYFRSTLYVVLWLWACVEDAQEFLTNEIFLVPVEALACPLWLVS